MAMVRWHNLSQRSSCRDQITTIIFIISGNVSACDLFHSFEMHFKIVVVNSCQVGVIARVCFLSFKVLFNTCMFMRVFENWLSILCLPEIYLQQSFEAKTHCKPPSHPPPGPTFSHPPLVSLSETRKMFEIVADKHNVGRLMLFFVWILYCCGNNLSLLTSVFDVCCQPWQYFINNDTLKSQQKK